MDAKGIYANELRVVLLSDDEGCYAQGLEIDHSATGPSLAIAKANFESGLADLVRHHMSAFGNLDGLLKSTPADTWADLWDTGRVYFVSSVSFQTRQELKVLPFAGISYFEQLPCATASSKGGRDRKTESPA